MEYLKKWGIEINKTTTITQSVKDLFFLIILLILSFYAVYFTPQNISRVFFLLPLFVFLLSNRNYLWFAYFFVLAQGPGYFFADFSGASQQRLPLYTFLAGMSFTPLDAFIVFALLKALIKGRKMKLKLRDPLLILLAYIIFSVGVNSAIYGTDIGVLAGNSRWVFCYSIIISFSYLVNQKHYIYRFIMLIFPFVFFVFFTQIYAVVTGNELINLFNSGFRGIELNSVTGDIRTVMAGELILLFSLLSALIMLVNKESKLPKLYLVSVITVSFISVFLSATRLWFLIFSFIMAGYVFVSKRKILSVLGISSILVLTTSVLIYSGLVSVDTLLYSPWMRLQQVFKVATGNVYMVDTARNRLVNQLPIIMEVIRQNPLIGYGFSDVTMNFYNNNLGFVNTILMFGVIGFSFFLLFFIKVFEMLISSIRKISINNAFRLPLKIIVLAWGGVLIGYFTTWDFFSMYFDKVFFVSILIVFTEFFVVQADKEEMLLQYQNIEGAQSMRT